MDVECGEHGVPKVLSDEVRLSVPVVHSDPEPYALPETSLNLWHPIVCEEDSFPGKYSPFFTSIHAFVFSSTEVGRQHPCLRHCFTPSVTQRNPNHLWHSLLRESLRAYVHVLSSFISEYFTDQIPQESACRRFSFQAKFFAPRPWALWYIHKLAMYFPPLDLGVDQMTRGANTLCRHNEKESAFTSLSVTSRDMSPPLPVWTLEGIQMSHLKRTPTLTPAKGWSSRTRTDPWPASFSEVRSPWGLRVTQVPQRGV